MLVVAVPLSLPNIPASLNGRNRQFQLATGGEEEGIALQIATAGLDMPPARPLNLGKLTFSAQRRIFPRSSCFSFRC